MLKEHKQAEALVTASTSAHFPSGVNSSLVPPLPRFLCALNRLSPSQELLPVVTHVTFTYTFLTGPSPSARLPIIYT